MASSSKINLSAFLDFKDGISRFKNINKSTFLAIFVVVSVLTLIVPLPGWLLDFGMTLNLVFSLAILLLALYVKKSIDIDVFPTLLLVNTIFGLGLNFSSTRLILSKGQNFDGQIVRLFSSFVTGSEGTLGLVIGFVMFSILMFVQLAVITKGSTRSAEVRARFKLDSMSPEKIDLQSDFQNGIISEEEFKQKSSDLKKTIDLFGGLDGASKFVSGNVKLGIFITVVNIVGGLIIGVVLHKESFSSAIANYLSFAIGDGLVSQLPSLLVSLASGIIITKGESEISVAESTFKQFRVNPSMYYIIATLLILMSFINFKSLFFLLFIAAGIIYIGYRISKIEAGDKGEKESHDAYSKGMVKGEDKEVLRLLDQISIEIGYGLVPLVEKDKNLLSMIKNLRNELGLEMGILIPKVRVKDSIGCIPNEYKIKIYGNRVGRGLLKYGSLLAIPTSDTTEEIKGEATTEPSFGLPAFWITEEQRSDAEIKKYAIVDCTTAIVTHLSEVLKRNMSEILTKDMVVKMLEPLKKEQSIIIEEMNSKHITTGIVQKVLKNLVEESVSVRNIASILETIIDYYDILGKTPDVLTEKVRYRLRAQICEKYKDDDDVLNCLVLDQDFQNYLVRKMEDSESDSLIYVLPRDILSIFINSLSNSMQKVIELGYSPIIIVPSEIRRAFRKLIAKDFATTPVLSIDEIPDNIKINVLSSIEIRNSQISEDKDYDEEEDDDIE